MTFFTYLDSCLSYPTLIMMQLYEYGFAYLHTVLGCSLFVKAKRESEERTTKDYFFSLYYCAYAAWLFI
jgi:hypothetical protein